MHIDHPAPGFYTRRMTKAGPVCAICIMDVTELDGNGEPLEDVRLEAFVNGVQVPVESVWPAKPCDAEEYARILEANRSAIGGNNPPEATPIEQARDMLDVVDFLTATADQIDAVKRINGLIAGIAAERKGIAEQYDQAKAAAIAEHKEVDQLLADAKAKLLACIAEVREDGETIRGRYASAFGRTERRLVIEDVAAIPARFMAPNVKAIEAALKAGEDVPGAYLDSREVTTVS